MERGLLCATLPWPVAELVVCALAPVLHETNGVGVSKHGALIDQGGLVLGEQLGAGFGSRCTEQVDVLEREIARADGCADNRQVPQLSSTAEFLLCGAHG
jgi:hypothetical protein